MLQIPLSLWSIKVFSFPSFFAGKRAKSSERIGRVRPKFFGSTTLCEDYFEILDVHAMAAAIERIVAEGGDQAIRFPPIQIR